MKRMTASLAGALMMTGAVFAGVVPSVLPRPDGTPADMSRPVQVYILAGQSNMVGFGQLDGARPMYPSIYLSADPAIKPGRMPVGPSALLPHGVYQSAARDAPAGAKVAVYAGAYRADTDYARMRPVQETTVALGTVEARLPSIDGPHTVVVDAFIDVPMTGAYELHVGHADSSYAVATLDGQEVYRKDVGQEVRLTRINLERGVRYPVRIAYSKGGSAALWMKLVDLQGQGDLRALIRQGRFPWFVDEDGNWTTRQDVTYVDTRLHPERGGRPLSPTVNTTGRLIGPEIPFGYVMGTYHDEHVLLMESSIGNRALNFDFRPPSSGKTEEEKANEWCGKEYDLLVAGVHDTLKNIETIVPGYQGNGYEMAGFVWWQGHKDSGQSKEEYERHLVNLIQDLRREFDAPEMRVAVATVAFGGDEVLEGPWKGVWEAQMAVGDAEQHPDFAGTVASVDARSFWRSPGESPTGTGFHYNHNAETFALTGEALGRAMVALMGGKAEPMEVPSAPEADPNVDLVYSEEVTGRFNRRGPHYPPAYYREMGTALQPMMLNGVIPEFLGQQFDSERPGPLAGIVRGHRPGRLPMDIRGPMDELVEFYDVAGLPEYGWQPFAPQLKGANWYYYSFEPPEQQPLDRSDRYRRITFPEGMENWFAADFDPARAGWRQGAAPFGRMGDQRDRLRPRCSGTHCGCSRAPATFWEHEVLLMRQTFDLPPVQDGHVYRLILGGAGCDRSGEGYAIYVNGRQLVQQSGGFFRNPGIRGAYLYDDILPEFKGGRVTIAVINFLRYTYFRNVTTYHGPHPDYRGEPVPPHGQVDLWMEQVQLSPAVLEAATE